MKHFSYALMRIVGRMLFADGLRRAVWRLMLKIRPLIPRELIIRPRDITVAVGIPYLGTIRRFSKAATGGRVIVIEADEDNRMLLENGIHDEDMKNVQVIGKAAWSSSGEISFLLAKRPEDHRIENAEILIDNDLREEQESGFYRERVTVQASTIDQMMQEVGAERIDYIEITVNGAELEVIKGMGEILSRTAVIFAKGHVIDKETGEPLNKAIAEYLRGYGFTTVITMPSKSVVDEWGSRQGDVYAWKTVR